MDLYLTRKQFREDGIFSELTDSDGQLIAMTLEHAYPNDSGFGPKIPNGVFICKRGEHYLHEMTTPFETFEITGVEGHVGLLFHWGNFNKDSEGCILLGESIQHVGIRPQAVTNSRATFKKFMDFLKSLDTFVLTVRDQV